MIEKLKEWATAEDNIRIFILNIKFLEKNSEN